jgi:hypothetical protein
MLFLVAGVFVSGMYFLNIPQRSNDTDSLNKRATAVWSGLLKIVSDDTNSKSKVLVEQGEQDEALYEDYLSAGAIQQQKS